MDNQTIKTYVEKKPWGKFERFTNNEQTTIKIITVKSREKLSLQYHEHRSEYWRILSGNGGVIIGERSLKIKKGDEFFIPIGTKHTAEAGDEDIVFLEIAFGHFDENDIIRLEDKYGRKT